MRFFKHKSELARWLKKLEVTLITCGRSWLRVSIDRLRACIAQAYQRPTPKHSNQTATQRSNE